MFKDIFIAHAKITIRNKQGFFWSALFPFVLANLFYFAFQNVISDDIFKLDPIPVAVVTEGEFTDKDAFMNFMNTVGTKSKEGKEHLEPITKEKDSLFHYIVTSSSDAEKLMIERKVYGTIEKGENLEFVLAPTSDPDYKAGIVESLLNQYQQNYSTFTELINQKSKEPGFQPSLVEDIVKEASNTDSKGLKDITPNRLSSPYIFIFFSLLGYAATLAMTAGIFYVSQELEADLSDNALRQEVSPIPKYKRFIAGALPNLLFQMLFSGLLFLYLNLLKIDFREQTLYILLLVEIGCIAGFFIGTGIATTFRKSKKILEGLAIGLPLFFASLAGMMSHVVAYYADKYVPFLQMINPVARISDGIYSLYYYEGYSRYTENVIGLLVISIVFILITVLNLRRNQYENI